MDTLPFMQRTTENRGNKRPPVSKYIIEKNPRAKAYDPPYYLNPKKVIRESKHTYTTEDNRTIHKKLSAKVRNPEIFQRPYNRLVEHSQKAHRDRFGRFASPGRGREEVLNFPVRNAAPNRNEFSSSSTPERTMREEPVVNESPVRQQTVTQNNRELGTPPTLNISVLSDDPGNVSRELGELNDETDIAGEINNNDNPRRSKRIPTAKRNHIPGATGAIIYN